MSKIVCRPRILTPTQAAQAMRRSLQVNPDNADSPIIVARTPAGRRGGPKRLAVSVGFRWPRTGVRLSVQFLDNPSRELRRKILEHMNAWNKTANVAFVETGEVGDVRIARYDHPPRDAGYWSYVGTEIMGIEADQPTMNLEGFTLDLDDAEFARVVRHEAGHTLGFEHEHMRASLVEKIDVRKAIAFYDEDQGWSAKETREQVLTPLEKSSIYGTTTADPSSIMCYEVPAKITKNGKAIVGGSDISPKDYAFAAKVYPKPRAARGEVATPAPLATLVAVPLAMEPPPSDESFHIMVLDACKPDDAPRTADAAKKATKAGASAATTKAADAKPAFLQVLATFGGARVTATMRTRAEGGAPTRFGDIIAIHERIKKYTNRDSGTLPSDRRMLEFGEDLFDTLFQGDVRRLYDEARSRRGGRKLDLIFTSMVPWIAEKPWEFAYDRARQSFLATEEVHFLRNVMTAIPTDVLVPRAGPLRILVASAQPVGFGTLSIEQETEVIRRGFEPLVAAGLVSVEVLPRATPGAIHQQLANGAFTVVHFIGHGTFDEDANDGEGGGALVFEDERGNESRLGERSVREIFCQRGVKLVFLNACQTGAGGRADFNKGVAQALMAHGLPALVANQYSVLDSSATQFSQYFYWALTQGHTVGEATREARIAVNYSMQGDSIDWAVPVVYARDPALRLCARPEQSTAAPATSTPRTRQVVARREFEVAVWDTDNVFPSLEDTLERLNLVQPYFGFDRANLSVPLDAWDMENKAENGTPYLWAEKLARRLARVPLELNVDALACITRHWLRDDDWMNIYGWWPAKDQPGILVLSFAGFEGLQAAGPDTHRALANTLVTALAGYLGDTGTHDRGARNCPLSFNAQRDLGHLVGAQSFDRACRTRLMARIPKAFGSLESITKAFASTGGRPK